MRNITVLLLTIIFLPNIALAAEKQDILKIFVHYDRGQANIESIEVGAGFVPGKKGIDVTAPVYWLEAIADNGELLERKEFNIHLEIMPEPPLPGEEYEPDSHPLLLEETMELVIIPYFPNIKWLNLYDANRNLIEKQDVAYLSQVCGNGICQNNENNSTCPSDCLADEKDAYCSLGSDTGCINTAKDDIMINKKTDSRKLSNKQIYLIFGIFLLLIAILIIIAYFFFKKTKKTVLDTGNNNPNNK